MCPDPQLLSIYVDGELPSPWKEKMEKHFSQCSVCGEKLENLKSLHELFKKDTSERRTIVDKSASDSAGTAEKHEMEFIEEAKTRIWRKLESRRRYKSGMRMWQRRLSVPLPAAAAAAAMVITVLTMLWLRGGRVDNSGFAQQTQESPYNFILAAEDEFPGIIPTSDISDVLQYLNPDGTDVIILRLPESRNFSRAGDPMIINAAEYPRR